MHPPAQTEPIVLSKNIVLTYDLPECSQGHSEIDEYFTDIGKHCVRLSACTYVLDTTFDVGPFYHLIKKIQSLGGRYNMINTDGKFYIGGALDEAQKEILKGMHIRPTNS